MVFRNESEVTMRQLLLLGMAAVLVAGCVGTQVRDEVLLPLAGEIYGAILPDIERGLASAVGKGEISEDAAQALVLAARAMKDAISNGDLAGLAGAPWDQLQIWAIRGIDEAVEEGEISLGVSQSLKQRVLNFGDLLHRILSPPGLGLPQGNSRAIRIKPYQVNNGPVGIYVGQRR